MRWSKRIRRRGKRHELLVGRSLSFGRRRYVFREPLIAGLRHVYGGWSLEADDIHVFAHGATICETLEMFEEVFDMQFRALARAPIYDLHLFALRARRALLRLVLSVASAR